jgi:PAS domain S-box-containing protein
VPTPGAMGPSRPAKGPPGESRPADSAELAEVRAQLRELQQTIEAIRTGEVDSLLIGPPGHEQVHLTADRSYRLIVEAMNEGAATVSTSWVILAANPRLGSMTGRDASELIGTPVLDLIAEADRAEFARLLDVAVGESARGEVDLTGLGGAAVPVQLAVSGFDLDGMLVRCLVLTDLTAPRAALRASEGRLGVLFDNAPIGVGEVTLSGELVRVNQYFCQFVGYTADEVLAMRGMADLLHSGDAEAHVAIRERIVSEEVDTYSADRRFVQKGGGVIWGEVQRSLVRDPVGHPLLYIDTVRDITAQREAEAEVRTLTAELEARVKQRTADLERSNENLQALTYSVAHDLSTPLRGLSGFTELLLEDYGELLGETGRGYAARIEAASVRMAAVIDDLLRLAQVSRADLNLVPVDLSGEVVAIAGELRAREPGRQVSFAIQSGVWATADRGLIRALLENLVENAWKFTARRDDASIEFAATTDDEATVCCYVRDNGVGFDPAYVDKLFQPFQRLHTAIEFPGTGTGLVSVQRIIERHGGRTWAEGAVDRGATFYFTLGAKVTP